MKEEEKQLLLKDLCGRLPYGVIVRGVFINYNKDKGKILYEECDKQLNYQDLSRYESLKPYLRPLSSMTEEEKLMYEGLMIGTDNVSYMLDVIDWLNAHHFDYRNLIERGMAIKVTEENNPYKN